MDCAQLDFSNSIVQVFIDATATSDRIPEAVPMKPEAPSTTKSSVRSLFRSQVLEHALARQYGTVIIARPISHQVLTVIFVMLAASVIAFFVLFSTTRKVQSQGVILPSAGVIRVMPGQAGVVQERRVKDGQQVKKGDVLFVLSSERGSSSDNTPEKIISALIEKRRDNLGTELAQARLQTSQRLAAAQQRARDLNFEIDRIAGQMTLQKRRLALTEQAYHRFSALKATNYISDAQLQEKEADVLDQRQRLAELERLKSTSQRELSTAQADALDLEVQGQRDASALQRDVSAIEQDLATNEARREFLVRAPHDGVATAVMADAGHTVSSATILASILPAGSKLEAEIYAPSRAIGFIKPGMTVLLRYQAYPYQKFGQYRATVREIASTSIAPRDLPLPDAVLSTGASQEPLYRIRLDLDTQTVNAYGKPLALKSGMLLDASILLEKRRLYEWVLEPLFSLSGRM